jgi:hypothetical protein
MNAHHSRLTPTDRALLRSRHGLTVSIESDGVAYCRDARGERVEYPIAHLQGLLRPTLRERFVHWVAGVQA